MKLGLVWTVSFVALTAGLATAARAQDVPFCSTARVAGEWGYAKTGTLYLPTGAAVPFASVGTFALDADGNVAGTQLASVAGNVGGGELYGTFTIDPDCTGEMTVGVYDPSGDLLRTVSMSVVIDDRARELRTLVTALVLPDGTPLPAVITGEARRIFPNRGDER